MMKEKKIWILIAGFFFCIVRSFSNVSNDHSLEEKQQLEMALARAAVSCYATEGSYPAELSYLEEHYGIRINNNRFAVKYEYIASNLMPDITVLELKP